MPGREAAPEELVVIVGTSFWDGTPLLEHHLALELARHHRVLYVEPPTSVVSRFRNREARSAARARGLHRVSPTLTLLSVRVPPLKERWWVKPTSLWFLRRALSRAVRQLGAPRVGALVATSMDDVLGCLHEDVGVYYAKDDYVAGAELVALPRRAIAGYIERLCATAQLVVAVSPVLVETLRGQGAEPILIPNGCDVAHFSTAAAPPVGAPPTAAFIGHLSNRVDVALLEAVADRGMRLRIVGPTQETLSPGHFDGLRGRPNVEWTGPVPYAALPAVLSDVTTGLLPYGDTAFNRASFPLKVLEYLAAGRRVVSTDLPAIRWLGTDLVTVAPDPGSFADAVEASMSAPLLAAEVEVRRDFARAHSWERRAEALMQAVARARAKAEPSAAARTEI
jgi:teichuronic acid biosynthesis glycosyltransferase TuaH